MKPLLDHSNAFETKNAVSIGFQTCVGHWGDYPRERGNCFSLECEDGSNYKICNFGVENLDYALKHNLISWPIKIHVLSERNAVIHDERIPHNWYQGEFCTICTPYELLLLPQKLKQARDILTGARVELEHGTQYEFSKMPQWKVVP